MSQSSEVAAIPEPDNRVNGVKARPFLTKVERSSVVDAVADRLREGILSGRLAAGSRLPAERELAVAFGVNRLTLRAALARLEALGLIATRHGSGTEVTSWRERAGLEALASMMGSLKPWEPTWKELLLSILGLRRVLASEALALATVRHTKADLERMRSIARDQATRVDDAVAFARGDIEFERAIIRAAGSIAMELVLNTFARFTDEHPRLVAALYDRREDSLVFYEASIALIESGDAGIARATMVGALTMIDDAWIARNDPSAPRTEKKASLKPPRTTSSKAKKKRIG